MIGQDTIHRVRDQTDLLALVRETTKLEKSGRSHRGLCPFHKEKTPSFYVNPERGSYHCFGCGAHGDAISFVEHVEGLSFIDAVRRLAERLGLTIEQSASDPERRQQAEQRRRQQELYDVGAAAASYFEKMLREHPLGEHARAELGRRGLVPSAPTDAIADALQAFRVGYAPYGWDGLGRHLRDLGLSHTAAEQVGLLVPRRSGPGHYDRFRHRLMFAVLDVQGRVVAFSGRALTDPTEEELRVAGIASAQPASPGEPAAKYVNSTESPIYKKREAVFGLYQARQAIREVGEAVVVEGNFDVVTLYAHGVRHVVAPLGTAFTLEQARLIKRFSPNIVFLFDGDRAGRAAVDKARSVCQEAELIARVGVLPDGMDPDGFVRARGPEAVKLLLKREAAQGMLDYLLAGALEDVRAPEMDVRQRAAGLQKVAELLASERDPAVRSTLREKADKFVQNLGITADSATFEAIYRSLHRPAGQPNLNASQKPQPEPPYRARSRDRSGEVPLQILGALLDYPELLGMEEVVSGLAVVEGDVAAAISAVRQAWEDSLEESSGVQGRRFREQVLAKVAPSIHGFASARLAVPENDSLEDARFRLLDNISKLHRLQQKPQKPEVVAELRRAAATGDVAEEDALLLAHQNRLMGQLERVLSKREQPTPVKR